MPIEIKELNINITVKENEQDKNNRNLTSADISKMKSEIIKDCTRKILNEIKQNQRR